MDSTINLQQIYQEEKRNWSATEAPRRTLRDLVALSVPWWIVIVGVGLYLLSAPHTAAIFNSLTPGFGWVAPTAVEFGLLYAAFRRKLAKEENETVPRTLTALQVLFFVTAVLVNTAGAFANVVKNESISRLSFAAISEQFGQLPATAQAELIMAALAGWIVPIGALSAGEGIAHLILQKRVGKFQEQRWREERFEILYRAVFTRLNGTGLPPAKAKRIAFQEVKGFLAEVQNKPERKSENSENSLKELPEGENIRRERGEAIKIMREYINSRAAEGPLTAGELVQNCKVGQATAYRFLSKYHQEQNQ